NSVITKQCSDDNKIGGGAFGIVYKIKGQYDGDFYAIKQIENAHQDESIREIESLLKVRSEFVVYYYCSWSADNYLYIQMEYCSQSLVNILNTKPEAFGRQPGEPMNSIEFYISCHIFREICECVQYLHEMNPLIIHRDLKPSNILIAHTVRNGRFIKLCDFGLATIHLQSMSHSENVGTFRYIAPETYDTRYTEKVDIYSLGIIAQDVFDVHL
ncbi:unnamed protein product, partial [Oppiella nova]